MQGCDYIVATTLLPCHHLVIINNLVITLLQLCNFHMGIWLNNHRMVIIKGLRNLCCFVQHLPDTCLQLNTVVLTTDNVYAWIFLVKTCNVGNRGFAGTQFQLEWFYLIEYFRIPSLILSSWKAKVWGIPLQKQPHGHDYDLIIKLFNIIHFNDECDMFTNAHTVDLKDGQPSSVTN